MFTSFCKMSESGLTFLSEKNPHERDLRIKFEEEGHKYTIDGECGKYTSVTTIVHRQFEQFDADKIIDKMMASPKWPQNKKYFGKTKEEIKKMWDDNRDEAATAGTKMHYDIECYYNNCPNDNDSIEYGYFKHFLKYTEQLVGDEVLTPYRTEWTVFDEDLQLAGSIDMCFIKGDGTIAIYDWKRSREIKKSSWFIKFSHNKVLSHIPDLNYWHYSLQLNIYKGILERKYNLKVSDMYLVCLHPNHKDYQRIKVNDMSVEIDQLFASL